MRFRTNSLPSGISEQVLSPSVSISCVIQKSAKHELSNTAVIVEDAGRIFRFENGRQVAGVNSSGGSWLDYNSEYYVHGGPTGAGCTVNCTNDNEIYSMHTGGAQALRGDGSIYFMKSTIAPGVLAAVITLLLAGVAILSHRAHTEAVIF